MSVNPPLNQVLDQAISLHEAGKLGEAENLYRLILAQNPSHLDALHLLGLISYQKQQHRDAIQLISRAITINNRVPIFHNHLGLALRSMGSRKKAVASFRHALKLDPDYLEAEVNLARLLHELNDKGEAERHYQHALALDPHCIEALDNLGRLFAELGRLEDAMACHQKALLLRPDYADAYGNLGNVLEKQGKTFEALAYYQRALSINPQLTGAHINIGNILVRQGRPDQAANHYEKALEQWPDSAPAHNGLGIALHDLHRGQDAVRHYRQAIVLDPEYADAHINLGEAMREEGRTEEAESHFHRALKIKPSNGVRFKLAMLLPVITSSTDEIHQKRSKMERAVTELMHQRLRLDSPEKEVGHANFYLAYHGINNKHLQIQIAQLYESACPSLLWIAPHCRKHTRRPGPIRIGFISKFLHLHSIGKTTCGLIDQFDRSQFQVYALGIPPFMDDELARFIRARADAFVEVPFPLQAARECIAALELDVLFYQDIGMEAFTYFLAFSRLAPMQCVSFGHPDTTGIRNMDYFISNDLFELDGAQEHYSEKLKLLHDLGTLAYYYRPKLPSTLKQRNDFDLPENEHLYICPQTLFKFHPDFDAIMGAILSSDPKGRLVLIEGKFPHWSELLMQRLARNLRETADRIIWLPQQKNTDFLNLLAICNVVLDIPHFNGMNSCLEAFAVGTPVVTMPLTLQRTRHTYGMYQKMGIHDCVAKNPEEYVNIAVRIGTDPDYRRTLHERILAANSVLYEDGQVVREFERFFIETMAR